MFPEAINQLNSDVYHLIFEFAYNHRPQELNTVIAKRIDKSRTLCVPEAWKNIFNYRRDGAIRWEVLLDLDGPELNFREIMRTLRMINWTNLRGKWLDPTAQLAVMYSKSECLRIINLRSRLGFKRAVCHTVMGLWNILRSPNLILVKRYMDRKYYRTHINFDRTCLSYKAQILPHFPSVVDMMIVRSTYA